MVSTVNFFFIKPLSLNISINSTSSHNALSNCSGLNFNLKKMMILELELH